MRRKAKPRRRGATLRWRAGMGVLVALTLVLVTQAGVVAAPIPLERAATDQQPVIREPRPPRRDAVETGDQLLPLPDAAAPPPPPTPKAVAGYAITANLPSTVARGIPAVLAVQVTAPPGTRVGVVAAGSGFTGCGLATGRPGITVTVPSTGHISTSCAVTAQPTKNYRVAAQLVHADRVTLIYAASGYLARVVDDRPGLTGRVAPAHWQNTSRSALARALAAPESPLGHSAASLGYQMRIDADLYGWSSARVREDYLALMALAKPDGGWGLDGPYDAGADGTVNPADTSYPVTTADHVGWALLKGYQHAAVPQAAVRQALTSIIAAPRAKDVPGGACVAYSNSAFDSGPCVWNVSLGVVPSSRPPLPRASW